MANFSDIIAEVPELAELAAHADGHQLHGAPSAHDWGMAPKDAASLPAVFDKHANFMLDLELLPWMAAFLIWLHVICADADIRLSTGHFWDKSGASEISVTVDGVLVRAQMQLCSYEGAGEYWCTLFVRVGTSDYHFWASLSDHDDPAKYDRILQKLKQALAHRNWYL